LIVAGTAGDVATAADRARRGGRAPIRAVTPRDERYSVVVRRSVVVSRTVRPGFVTTILLAVSVPPSLE
jgi:hypothetical protein